MTDRTFKIMVAVPFALIPLALIGGKSVSFDKVILKPAEIEAIEYTGSSQENGVIIEDRWASVPLRTAGFNPFLAVGNEAWPAWQESRSQADDDGRLHVTLTVLNAAGSVAVINDTVVREGDSIRGMIVKRIESNRVFLTNGKSLPVYPEGSK